ncbi:MAG: crossover junction endodeoxyribonuclease RuvC [Gammaproteobacteria bacterium]
MTRILGIDPGSRITGYGVIDVEAGRMGFVDCGTVRTEGGPLPGRLKIIFEGVGELIRMHEPTQLAIEQVFVNINVDSALKLGQARGAAICAAVVAGLPVAEYSPKEIKKAVVGRGGAAKEQVQHMITALLDLPRKPQADAADALAVAVCHGNAAHTAARIPAAGRSRGGRWR